MATYKKLYTCNATTSPLKHSTKYSILKLENIRAMGYYHIDTELDTLYIYLTDGENAHRVGFDLTYGTYIMADITTETAGSSNGTYYAFTNLSNYATEGSIGYDFIKSVWARVYWKGSGDNCCCPKGDIVELNEATTHDCNEHYNHPIITTEPTCTRQGVLTATCQLCNATYTESIPATGHNYDYDNAVKTEATECGDFSYWTAKCTKCGTSSDYDYTKLEHIDEDNNGRCDNCNEIMDDHIHDWGEWKNEALLETINHRRYCTICGDYEDSKHDNVNPTGEVDSIFHDLRCETCGGEWGKKHTEDCLYAAQIMTNGANVHGIFCKHDTGDTPYQISTEAHSFDTLVENKVDPTCTTYGKTALYECKCGAESGGVQISKLPHVYDKEVVAQKYLKSAADCGNPAKYYKSCKCGAVSTTATFDNGSPVGTHVETASGSLDRPCMVCMVCDNVVQESHSIKYDKLDNGKHKKRCTRCSSYKTENCTYGSYSSNGNTTHTKTCICGNSITESHNIVNNRCVCGYTGPNGGCVFAGTQIALDADTSIDIVDFVGGTPIDFCNPDTLEHSSQQTLTRFFYTKATKKVVLTLEDGKTIEVTPNHVVLTEEGFKTYLDNYDYLKYKVGDKLATVDGYKELVSIQEEEVPETTVYNIATENSLMVANGIIVAGELNYNTETIVLGGNTSKELT